MTYEEQNFIEDLDWLMRRHKVKIDYNFNGSIDDSLVVKNAVFVGININVSLTHIIEELER